MDLKGDQLWSPEALETSPYSDDTRDAAEF